ncbi:MAG: hypothetical protein QXO19_03170, partial [Candidatus Aenigmatarchaeota archaeon]
LALKRAEDAKMSYALETTGKFNVIAFITNNWKEVLLSSLVLTFVCLIIYIRIRLFIIDHRLRRLNEEEKIIIGLIKEVQKETFEENKLSMEEYLTTMQQYNNRLSKIAQEIIKYETLRSSIITFKPEKARLLQEKERLIKLMKETQKLYMIAGRLETSIYKNKMNSYKERLSEIEERLSTIEATEAIKKQEKGFKFKLEKI